MPDEETEKSTAADAGAESDPESLSGEELRARIEEQFRRQDVGDVVVQFMISLSNLAYMKMGLTEETREIKDEAQSRLAIDSFKALLDAAGGGLPEQDQSSLAGALASMQLMFVREFAAADAGAAAGGRASDDGEGGRASDEGEGGSAPDQSEGDSGAASDDGEAEAAGNESG